MLLCVDVHYGESRAVVGCVGFADWAAPASSLELVVRSEKPPEAYEPGKLYLREMPYILGAVAQIERLGQIELLIVDAHAWLDEDRPGLGAHLHAALDGRCPVIGVAKSPFRGSSALPVLRGDSRSPLFVSAAGMDAGLAAERVAAMHGEHRVPTLIRRADQLARGLALPDAEKTPADFSLRK
ncbi:MAG: endonuclease V [Deltaproteobacteria bacterium]|nr:endonuclease V [Deltaproteobacteria bacterium]